MNLLKIFSKIVMSGILGFLLLNCEKEDAQQKGLLTANSSAEAGNYSNHLKSANLPPEYLRDLIKSINSMVDKGILSKGEGQSLIAKANNAIKSIQKGNTNAVNGQLGAFNAEVEYFVDNGTLTSQQGQSLTNVADYVVDFPDVSFTDPRDGHKYSVVLIGDQVWMDENLVATKYNDGTDIPLVTVDNEWKTLTTPAFCWYKNDYDTYGTTYGALYNWYTVNTGKLCPAGWHVPTDADWTFLTTYLGGESIAGGKLKETGTSHWLSPNTGATNETGFTALPGGLRGAYNGGFYQSSMVGFWWSSVEFSSIYAWNCYMQTDNTWIVKNFIEKVDGLSVRCIKD